MVARAEEDVSHHVLRERAVPAYDEPIANSLIFIYRTRRRASQADAVENTTTDADGNFNMTFPRQQPSTEMGILKDGGANPLLVVKMDASGEPPSGAIPVIKPDPVSENHRKCFFYDHLTNRSSRNSPLSPARPSVPT